MSSLLKLRRGSTVAHETFTGADGEVTFNTDTNQLVSHDGATAGGFPHTKSTDLAASSGAALVGYLPAGTGADPTTVQAKLRESVSVLDFGAVGDGVTDDTASFVAAIAAVADAGQIFIPTGVYLIDSTIIINKRVSIIGTGNVEQVTAGYVAGTEIRKAATLNGAVFEIAQGKVNIESLWLKGLAGNGGGGIYVRAPNFSAKSVTVSGMGDAGFTIGGVGAGINVNTWRLDACVSIGNAYGYIFNDNDTVVDCNAGTATNIKSSGNTYDGMYVHQAEKNTFIGSLNEANGRYGINIWSGSKNNVFIGGDNEQNVTADVNIHASAGDTVLVDLGIAGIITDASLSTTHIGYGLNTTFPYLWSLNAVSQVKYSGARPVVTTGNHTAPCASAAGQTVYFPVENSKTVTVTPSSFAMLFFVQFGGGSSTIAFADWENATINFLVTPPASIAATSTPSATQLGIYKSAGSYDIKFVSGSNLTPQGVLAITFLGCSVGTVSAWV